MDPHLSNIYGTGGFEKTASAESGLAETLSDLALYIAHSISEEGEDLEKIAQAHNYILDELVAYDQAGRALAHAEFEELEKQAQAGDTTGLEQFFSDVGEAEDTEIGDDEVRMAIVRELQRRLDSE
tara:strand:+ start:75 stop:452 length:378 start_codon:yes stop_codon:yes gene_type:complete